jgi:signal transduction histidine kinase/CheY-like chemotaxis protein
VWPTGENEPVEEDRPWSAARGGLWEKLTAPRATDRDVAGREALTKAVLLALALPLSACGLVFLVGWPLGAFPADIGLISIGLAGLSAGAWLFVHWTGRWRGACLLLPWAALALAVTDALRYGLTSLTLMEFTVATIMGAVLLGGPWLWAIIAAAVLGIAVGFAWEWSLAPTAAAAEKAASQAVYVSLFILLVGVVLRVSRSRLEVALRQAHADAETVARDNLERRRVEDALRASEERYRQISETISDLAYSGRFDEQGRFAWEWSAGHLPGLPAAPNGPLSAPDGFLDLVHPDDRIALRERSERLRGGEADVMEYRVVTRTGQVRWVRDFSKPITDEAGQVTGMCGALQDVTQRKRSEAALNAIISSTLGSGGHLVFEGITESVCEWLELDGALIAERSGAGQLQTLSMRLDGRSMPVRAWAIAESPWEEVLRSGRCALTEDAWQRFASEPPLDAVGAEGFLGLPLLDSTGQGIGVLAVVSRRALALSAQVEDALATIATIASAELERQRADRERRRLEERLRHSEKIEAIGQLAGGVAHDFNNQLVGIMGFADLLLARETDPSFRRYLEGILGASRRAADLTRQLLAFARRGQYISVVVDLDAVVREVMGLLERSIDKRIRLGASLQAEPATTLGDPTQLQSALLNVALNARDAMPDGGELVFATERVELDEAHCRAHGDTRPGTFIRVTVSDSGVGMDADTLRRLFDPFFTTKPPGKGTGMGLPAVYGTVKAHGGCVDVESQVGRGTRLMVHLPLVEAPVEPVAAEPPLEPVRGAHVMVVDDEEVVRSVAEEALKDLGYRVTVCVDGEEAVTVFREKWSDIDVVLLDLVMPRMGGHEAFMAMRRIHPGLRVVLCSGYSLSAEARSLLTQDGVAGFLQKPFLVPDLARAVAEALAKDSS